MAIVKSSAGTWNPAKAECYPHLAKDDLALVIKAEIRELRGSEKADAGVAGN
jgi:hypothetical protein